MLIFASPEQRRSCCRTGNQSSHAHTQEKMKRKKSNIKQPQKCLQEAWSSSTATCEVSAHCVQKQTGRLQERFLFCKCFWFYSKQSSFWVSFLVFCFTFNGAIPPFLAVCLIGQCRRKRHIPENPACTNSIRIKLVPSKCHIYLRLYFFLKYSVNTEKCHGQSSFVGDQVTDQLNMPTEIGQVHIFSSTPSLRQLWFGVD